MTEFPLATKAICFSLWYQRTVFPPRAETSQVTVTFSNSSTQVMFFAGLSVSNVTPKRIGHPAQAYIFNNILKFFIILLIGKDKAYLQPIYRYTKKPRSKIFQNIFGQPFSFFAKLYLYLLCPLTQRNVTKIHRIFIIECNQSLAVTVQLTGYNDHWNRISSSML